MRQKQKELVGRLRVIRQHPNNQMLEQLLKNLKRRSSLEKEPEKSRRLLDVIDLSFKMAEKKYQRNVQKMQRKMQKYSHEIKSLKSNLTHLKSKKKKLNFVETNEASPRETTRSREIISELNKKLNQTNHGIQE